MPIHRRMVCILIEHMINTVNFSYVGIEDFIIFGEEELWLREGLNRLGGLDVAGFERGVLPIGDWSMSITLSKYSTPSARVYFPNACFDPLCVLASMGYTISLTKLDFPLPDTPVTAVINPTGNFTSIFFKLFW